MNIKTIKPTRNNVLVRLRSIHSNVVNLGPVDIEIPVDANNLSQMMQTEGTVIKCPESLNSTPWATTIEIKEGDNIVFSFNALRDSINYKGAMFEEGGEIYALLNYHMLIAVKEGDSIKPLNGFCFIEPINEEDLPASVKKKVSESIHSLPTISGRFGKLLAIGKPNFSYETEDLVDFREDIPIGSIVLFKKNSNIVAQYGTHATLFGKREIYRMQRRRILAWVELDEGDK